MVKPFLGALALVACVSSAAADEVQLVNGRKLEGIVITDAKQPGKVIVDVGAGTITLNAEEVSSVTKKRSALHEYAEMWENVRHSKAAKDYYDLALWAKENKVIKFVRPLCSRVVELDPNHEGAHRELGHEKSGGKWITFEEAQAAKGFVLFEGRWVTSAELALIESRRLSARERALAREVERDRKKEEERRRREDAEDAAIRRIVESAPPYGAPYAPRWDSPYPYAPYSYGAYPYGFYPRLFAPFYLTALPGYAWKSAGCYFRR